jgi:squalene-associated FAD-dependent desaturase
MSGGRVTPGRVVVIGGGLAGIRAALSLADAGAEVTLVERRRWLGGLTWSFQRHGLWFDNGQHVFLRCCTAYRQLLARIEASGAVHLQRRLSVPVLAPGGSTAAISRGRLPAPAHLGPSLLRYRHLSRGDRLRLFRPALALRRLQPDDPRLDTVTFGAWLREQGQSDRAIDRLWNLIALPTLNLPASQASLALAVRVFRTGLLDQAENGDLGWSSVPLGELHGGHAARALERCGVETVLGTSVRSVTTGTASRFVVQGDQREWEAASVVVATPPEVARRLVPDAGLDATAGLGRSPIVNVHLVLDRTVTDLPFAAAVDSPIQFVFDRTGSSGVRSGQCLSISLSAADEYIGQRPDALIRTFFAALPTLLPAARRAELRDGVVSRERAATFRGVPGTRGLRPSARTRVPDLFVAGAWCDTGWPDTMEGAVRSGLLAAAAVVGDGGLRPDSHPRETVLA